MNNEIIIKIGGPLLCGEIVNIEENTINESVGSSVGLWEQIREIERRYYDTNNMQQDLDMILRGSYNQDRNFTMYTGSSGMNVFNTALNSSINTINNQYSSEHPLTPIDAFHTSNSSFVQNASESYRMDFIDFSNRITNSMTLSQEDIESINEVRELARRRNEF